MEPLPGGVLDTGFTIDLSLSCTGTFVEFDTTGDLGVEHRIKMGPWEIVGRTESSGGITYFLDAGFGPLLGAPNLAGTNPIEVAELDYLTDPNIDNNIEEPGGPCEITYTAGPLRVGIVRELIPGFEDEKPLRAIHYRHRFSVWKDEDTVEVGTVTGPDGGGTVTGTFDAMMTPEEVDMESFSFLFSFARASQPASDGKIWQTIEDITINGAGVDVSDLDEIDNGWRLLGSGSSVEGRQHNGSGAGEELGFSVLLPYLIEYDLDVLKNGGASTNAEVDTLNEGTVTVPFTASVTHRRVSWAAGTLSQAKESASVNAAWAAAEDIPWDDEDLRCRLWTPPPLGDPATDATYEPVEVELAAEVELYRPGAATPSAWVTLDGGDCTVTDGADTLFEVSAPGGGGTRVIGAVGTDLPAWRPWLGVGASGKADGDFDPDKTHWTKAGATEDPFDYSSYRYRRLIINSTVAATGTLTIRGVSPVVTDSHVTGSDRETDFTVDESATFEHSYSGALSIGSNTVMVDLCFPDAGGPVYLGRVDSYDLTFSAVGDYTLSADELVSCTAPSTPGAGTAYMKCGFGKPVERPDDFDALHCAHNGAACMAALTDRVQCSEHFGVDGRGLRFVNVSTGAVSGLVLDTQLTLEQFWDQLDKLQGWSVSYNSGVSEAALEDAFGNAFGPEIAEFGNDILPHDTITAGSPFTLPCQPKCGEIIIVPLVPVLIRTRDSIGFGALEGLAKTEDGLPAPAETIDVLRNDTSAVVDTPTTDAFAYWFSTPLPANGSFIWEVGTDLVELIARDRIRVTAVLPADEFHQDLIQMGVGWWLKSYRIAEDAVVRRSLDATATWSETWTVAGGLETTGTPSIPTLAVSRWDDTFVVVHDSTGATKVYLFNPITDGWALTATHAGKRYPRLVIQLHRQVLAAHDGTDLRFWSSDDYGVNLTALAGLTIAAVPVQLCVLREDRRGILHVVYVDGSDNLLHRYSEDGESWSAAETLDTGVTGYVGYGLTTPFALVTYWKTTTLHAVRLEEDYRSVAATLTPPSGLTVGTVPVWGSNREDFHLAAKAGADLEIHYTPDGGATFAEVA
jgi:hypothetical protein